MYHLKLATSACSLKRIHFIFLNQLISAHALQALSLLQWRNGKAPLIYRYSSCALRFELTTSARSLKVIILKEGRPRCVQNSPPDYFPARAVVE